MKYYFIFFLIPFGFNAQISIPAVYTQNFGTTDINAWTNNSTFAGWYIESTGIPQRLHFKHI